jgi:hypothetical protein
LRPLDHVSVLAMLEAVIDCVVAVAFFALTYWAVAATIKVCDQRRAGGARDSA